MVDNKDNENLYQAIKHLDPFPDHSTFKELRTTQQNIKYSRGKFSLLEVMLLFNSGNHSMVLVTNEVKSADGLEISYCLAIKACLFTVCCICVFVNAFRS